MGAAIVPKDAGADNRVIFVQHHQPVHLAARADALDLRRIKPVQQRGDAVADRRPPIGGVLLAPTGMRESNRVFPADDVGNAARFVHQQQLHRRGAEVDPNIVHIFVSSLRKIYPLTPKTFV